MLQLPSPKTKGMALFRDLNQPEILKNKNKHPKTLENFLSISSKI